VNVILYTVPHSGTNFVEKFLNTLGITESIIRIHVTQLDDAKIIESQHHLTQLEMLASSKPTIITARDPYLSAIRLLQREHRTMTLLKKRWDRFFKTIPTMNYHIIDIGVKEEDRYTHLCQAADFLKVKYSEQKVRAFADEWKPENETTSDAKTKYLETGELPEFYDWSLLDEAVEWYRNLPTN
jgi:hypothetical protein